MCILLTPVFASDYDSSAQELKEIGLFKGTDAGFDLDRSPTRTEAAVMLVRLLGAEEKAKTQLATGTISHPFVDVPDWADACIAWLYSNKLTNGLSETMYGATGQCTDKMYCTFVLRSLGYSDSSGADFTFDEAVSLAEDIGIYDSDMTVGTFLRDQAVAISYEALAAYMKDGSSTLLEKLVSNGAVTGSAANTLIAKVEAYNSYLDAYYKWTSESSMDMTVNESKQYSSSSFKLSTASQSQSKVIHTDNDIKVESITTWIDGDNTFTSSLWLKDGCVYVKSGSQKYKYFAGGDTVDEILGSEFSSTKPVVFFLSAIGEMSSSRNGSDTIFKITVPDYQMNIDDIQSDLEGMTVNNASVKSYTTTVVVDGNGMIKTYTTKINYTIMAVVDGQPANIDCKYEYNSIVNSFGDAVSIQYPDFSDYTLR